MRTAERALSTPRTSVAAARSPCGGPAGTYERRLTYRDPRFGRGLAATAPVQIRPRTPPDHRDPKLGRAAFFRPPPQLGLDELVDVPVQHPVHIADLEVRPVVLHQPVRREDVGADLGAEIDPPALASKRLEPLLLLPSHPFGQPGLQDPHSDRPVQWIGTRRPGGPWGRSRCPPRRSPRGGG